MNFPLEVAKTFHPNEVARLRCSFVCPDANTCTGLEAHMLEKLRLFEESSAGYVASKLGAEVSKHAAHSYDQTSPPVLTDR